MNMQQRKALAWGLVGLVPVVGISAYAQGAVTGLQNGWAIAGDYLSAASFLGIAGLISQYGYDGFMYSVGGLVAYITVLLVIASLLGDPAKAMSAAELGQRFLEPGLYFKAPIDQISLGMALVFGTAGLPPID